MTPNKCGSNAPEEKVSISQKNVHAFRSRKKKAQSLGKHFKQLKKRKISRIGSLDIHLTGPPH
jgi:hypothetical protein